MGTSCKNHMIMSQQDIDVDAIRSQHSHCHRALTLSSMAMSSSLLPPLSHSGQLSMYSHAYVCASGMHRVDSHRDWPWQSASTLYHFLRDSSNLRCVSQYPAPILLWVAFYNMEKLQLLTFSSIEGYQNWAYCFQIWMNI